MNVSRTYNSKKSLLAILETMAQTGDKDAIALIADYKNGLISIQDGTLRTIQQANAVSDVSLFEATSEKRTGVYSLSKSQLDKGVAFFVTGIALLAYQVTDTAGGVTTPRVMSPRSDAEYAAMLAGDRFANIAGIPALANGELSIRVNRKPILDKLATSVFNNATAVAPVTVGPTGFYALDNPIFIKPEVPLEATLRLPIATPASTLVEMVLYGCSTLAT